MSDFGEYIDKIRQLEQVRLQKEVRLNAARVALATFLLCWLSFTTALM